MTNIGDLLLEPVRNGIYKQAEHHGSGAKIVNMGELFSNPRLGDIPMKRVEVSDDELRRFELRSGDLLFARRSLIAEGAGAVCLVSATGDATVFESSIIRARPDPSKVDSRFLFYWFRSAVGRAALASILRQTAVSGVTGKDLMRLSLELPLLREQSSAADVLTSIDDKIAVNHVLAQTLGDIAHAVYKSWFVDFDPVLRGAIGKGNGLPAELAALFPSQPGDDGLPDGWEVKSVGDVFDVVAGNTPSTEEERFWKGPHAWTTPKDLSRLSLPVLLAASRTLTEAGLGACSSGLLPKGTLLLSSRAPIGYLGFANLPTAINQGIAGFRRRDLSTSFAWVWCQAEMPLIKATANGSTFMEISKGNLRRLPMIQAPKPVMDAFIAVVDPLVERIVAITEQNLALASLRDTLLPKLVSGELCIRDAETIAESV
jgi:type I restriction enzyme S subunit